MRTLVRASFVALLIMTVTGCATNGKTSAPSALPGTGSPTANQLGESSRSQSYQAP
jgi:hypothetical protein